MSNIIKDVSWEKFDFDVQLQDSVIRRLEIIGGAVKNLPAEIKQLTPHIPWRDIADMRNVLIHEYFGIDKDLVWKVIKDELPPLKKEIKILLKQLSKK